MSTENVLNVQLLSNKSPVSNFMLNILLHDRIIVNIVDEFDTNIIIPPFKHVSVFKRCLSNFLRFCFDLPLSYGFLRILGPYMFSVCIEFNLDFS